MAKGFNSPDLSGRLPVSRPLSRSPDFTTILPINEIVTYHFLVFCSSVEIFYFSVFICLSASKLPSSYMSKLVILSWSPICTSIQHLLRHRNPSILKLTYLSFQFFLNSQSREQNYDRYRTCPEYFLE